MHSTPEPAFKVKEKKNRQILKGQKKKDKMTSHTDSSINVKERKKEARSRKVRLGIRKQENHGFQNAENESQMGNKRMT